MIYSVIITKSTCPRSQYILNIAAVKILKTTRKRIKPAPALVAKKIEYPIRMNSNGLEKSIASTK